jgi:phosphohistidine phosphatase SixA
LAGALDLGAVGATIAEHGSPRSVVLVGHDPDFSDLLATLCGADIPMRKGALARIEADLPLEPGTGVLRWLVPPDLLRGDA